MLIPIPIASGFYESESLPISAQECVNWYPNIVQSSGLSQETLFGTDGILELASTGTVAEINRGSLVKNDLAYCVNGTTLYRVNRVMVAGVPDTFTTTSLGTVPGSGNVSMAENDTQLMISKPSAHLSNK